MHCTAKDTQVAFANIKCTVCSRAHSLFALTARVRMRCPYGPPYHSSTLLGRAGASPYLVVLTAILSIYICVFIGASLSEPQGVMMSTALACVRTCVHACVRTYVRVGEACLGTSEIWLRAI